MKKTKTDPSGQRANRRRADKALTKRLDASRREITNLFNNIPRRIVVNAQSVSYTYDLTPEQLEDFNQEVRAILSLSLFSVGNVPDRLPIEWWFKPYLELPVRQGYLEEVIQFNQLIKIANVRGIPGRNGAPAQIIPIELALTTQDYLNELNGAYISGFNSIKSLDTRTADQVIQVVAAGIKAKNTPTQIAEEITGRFDVANTNAERIAFTEVQTAYNNARMRAVEVAADQTGLTAGVIHLSALLGTNADGQIRTREHHAARHGNFYLVSDQLKWWDEGANRINCYCTTKSALLDGEGNIVEN